LFHRSTEQNPETSGSYVYDFDQVGAYFWVRNGALLYKLKPQGLLPPSLVAGLLLSLKGIYEPAFSEIWLQSLIASFIFAQCTFNF